MRLEVMKGSPNLTAQFKPEEADAVRAACASVGYTAGSVIRLLIRGFCARPIEERQTIVQALIESEPRNHEILMRPLVADVPGKPGQPPRLAPRMKKLQEERARQAKEATVEVRARKAAMVKRYG